jgi:hypothetical protein
MASTITAAQVLSISVALVSAGGIAALSAFDIPELRSQPASRSLPVTRWLFSRGSHIFPQAAFISSAGFAYLATDAIPSGQLSRILEHAAKGGKVSGYLAAAALTFGIAPFTAFVMIPTNFTLIKKNEDLGGSRSEASAKESNGSSGRSAEDSVWGKGQAAEFTDLSDPQGKTAKESSDRDEEEVKTLLTKFGTLNNVRAVLMGVGGLVGLWTALAA